MNDEEPRRDGRMEPSRFRQSEAQTLVGVLTEYEALGFDGQFGARDGARILCFTCRQESAAGAVDVPEIRRLEGASDPADMLAVIPITCPRCATRGTLVLGYGPDAVLEDSEVLAAIPPAPPLTPSDPADLGTA